MKKATFFTGVTREVYLGERPKAWERSGLEMELAIGGGETSKVRDFRSHRRDLRLLERGQHERKCVDYDLAGVKDSLLLK